MIDEAGTVIATVNDRVAGDSPLSRREVSGLG